MGNVTKTAIRETNLELKLWVEPGALKLPSPSNDSYTRDFQRPSCGSTQNVTDKQAHTGPPSSSTKQIWGQRTGPISAAGRDPTDAAAVTHGSACFPPRIQLAGRVIALWLDSTLAGCVPSPAPPCTAILNRPLSSWNISTGIMSIKHREASTTEGTLERTTDAQPKALGRQVGVFLIWPALTH